MRELIPRVKHLWETNRETLYEVAEKITQSIAHISKVEPGSFPDAGVIDLAFVKLIESYDSIYGGFGTQPKFPTPQNLLFLIRYYFRKKNQKAFVMVVNTLEKMRIGGIYDQIGHGFHRYSTDREWAVHTLRRC